MTAQTTHLSTGNHQIHLPPRRTHELPKLLADPLKYAQSIVIRQRLEEVLDRVALVLGAHVPLQLLDDLRLVPRAQGRGHEDLGEIDVFLHHFVEGRERFGDRVQGGGFDCCGVLYLLCSWSV